MKVCGINKEGCNEVMDFTANDWNFGHFMASGFFSVMVKIKKFYVNQVPEAFDYFSGLNNFSWPPSCLTEAI